MIYVQSLQFVFKFLKEGIEEMSVNFSKYYAVNTFVRCYSSW